MSSQSLSALRVENLRKAFSVQGAEFVALSGIDLEVARGEFVCVVGGSGCGKTTLLRIIGGLEPQFDGAVLLENRAVKGPGPDRGFVFQEHRLLPWLDVQGNVGFGLAGRSAVERNQLVAHLPGTGWANRICEALSASAFRRHGAARGHRSRAGKSSAGALAR
jgi:ABC-type nitrate/sulfonate/bicarbonate transport system ATPase subunit